MKKTRTNLSMVRSTTFPSHYCSHHRLLSDLFRGFFFITITLVFITCLYIFFYISSTSDFFSTHHHHHHHHRRSHIFPKPGIGFSYSAPFESSSDVHNLLANGSQKAGDQLPAHQSLEEPMSKNGKYVSNGVFHEKDIFLEDYKQMKKNFKIYVYPHKKDDPFAHVFLPVNGEPKGNYASENYFKKVLMQSHFITKDPSEADLFFLPFSIVSLRYDPRVSVGGIPDFIRAYILNISHIYPYWNRSRGMDHFYVACHSIGRSAMDKAEEVKFNAIQVVCSSSYFLSGYITHKDASLPQIWPRKGYPQSINFSKRDKLAFFAGTSNSPVRQELLKFWGNDSDIFVRSGRLPTPYANALLGSKFCLHVKGFEVNTARIGDSIYYGCVPVIIADQYDLPFVDILNWKSFSLVVTTSDIPILKRILQGVRSEDYTTLQTNVLKVRKHFQWNLFPVEYDTFYMVMYDLWLRRSSKISSINGLIEHDKNHGTNSSFII